jgi:pyruvate dehydrogenase E2 component (dihydrolipoamide acetyltransferase)
LGLPGGLTRRETVPLDGIRRVVADRMWESLQRTAQLTLTMEADATALVDLRGHLVPAAKVYGHRPPTYTDLLVFLVARVLPRHPLLNSSLVGEGSGREIAVWQEINLGVAVALERGLVVPVLKGADQKPLQTISQELAGAAERARAGRLEMADLAGGTFTITNLGQMEVEYFTPIINPPQAAILGVGRILKKPAVVGDEVVARQMLPLSLTFDHRVVDGAPAGAFLRDVKHAIEAATLEG